MPAPLFALVSSLGWGTSDYFGGRRSAEIGLLRTLFVSQLVSTAVLVVLAGALGGAPPAAVVGPAVLAGLAEAIGVACLYRGISVGAVGLVAPASSASPVVPVLAGLVLGDAPSVLEGAGLVLILGGLVVAARVSGPAARRTFDRTSVGYGLVSALGFGWYFVLMDTASAHSVAWALLIARATAVACAGIALAATRTNPMSMTGRQFCDLAVIGAIVVVADGSYAIATTLGTLSLVAILSATHPVVTVLWARFHAKERLSRLRIGGIALTLLGVVAVTAG